MNRLTLSIIMILSIILGGSYLVINFYQGYASAVTAARYNQTCFNYGLNLTEVMQGNDTENVAGCSCRFGSYGVRLNCICDCELKDFPIQACHLLEGCYDSAGKCYCSISVSFE